MKWFILVLLLTGSFSISALAQTNPVTSKADSLFTHYKMKKALKAYNNVLVEHPDDVSALWHSSLLYSRLGHRLKKKEHKEKYYRKAKKRAEHALQIDSTSSNANFAMSVALGRMALIVGTKQKVAAARSIKKYADLALKYDSTNDGAWNVLGRWNYEISNLNFIERMAANTIYGGVPNGASVKKAVKYCKKAIALDPKFIIYYRDLAEAYEELGKDKKAVQTCQQALKKPSLTPIDKKFKKECRSLIKHHQ
ncbi:MAG TPA: tetratricopeptide repeat protein [Balneolaceae bacterium]|nr:tetratricopeptide repeat protein [Balneolaceae bacterium]